MKANQEQEVRSIVRNQVKGYAAAFEDRHMLELDNEDGVINSKVHNIFVAALGDEIRFFSALVRSLDSSLGSLVEGIALAIAEEHFVVSRNVEGSLYAAQTLAIAEILEEYKSRRSKPSIADYQKLRTLTTGKNASKRHDSDYVLQNRTTGEYALIELKLGGDLDNKKARSEKEALLEQYCILCNREGRNAKISLYFATGYNRYGEGKPWKQERVRQFFAPEELLISADFWNFVAQSPRGFQTVLDEYNKNAPIVRDAILRVKSAYIKQ